MKKLAILAYHKVGPPPGEWYTWNYVSEEIFEKQLRGLQEEEWQVIDETLFLDGLKNPATLPEKSVLITFDDGYRSNLKIAAPILKKFSYPAIVFVPTAFVGGYNAFDADIEYEPKEELCSWEELLELEKNNITIQSHGVNHLHFSQLSDEEQLTELKDSKEILEKRLNKVIDLFSFPYGDYGLDQKKIIGKLSIVGYKAACLYGGKPVDFSSFSPFFLERIAVGPDTNLRTELNK